VFPVVFITAQAGEIDADPSGATGVDVDVIVIVGDIVGDTKSVIVGVLDMVCVIVALSHSVSVGDGPSVFVVVAVIWLVADGVFIKSIIGAVGSIFFGLHDCPNTSIRAAVARTFNAPALFFILSPPEILLILYHPGSIQAILHNTERLR
jgi:hypothetical protein